MSWLNIAKIKLKVEAWTKEQYSVTIISSSWQSKAFAIPVPRWIPSDFENFPKAEWTVLESRLDRIEYSFRTMQQICSLRSCWFHFRFLTHLLFLFFFITSRCFMQPCYLIKLWQSRIFRQLQSFKNSEVDYIVKFASQTLQNWT